MIINILGKLYAVYGNDMPNNYRGIERKESPDDYKTGFKTEYDSLIYQDLYTTADKSRSLLDTLFFKINFEKYSNEELELIIFKELNEEVPNTIEYQSLGFEVITMYPLISLIANCFRTKSLMMSNVYKNYQSKLNQNLLFSNISDANCFIEDLYEIRNNAPTLFPEHIDTDFVIFEVLLVDNICFDI